MPLDLGDLKDLNEFLDGGAYVTFEGKSYRFPPVSGELGLWGRRAAALRSKLTDAATPDEMERVAKAIGEPPIPDGLTLNEALLSPETHAELIADGVDDATIRHLAQTLYYRIVGGDALALAFYRDDEGPKAPANRAERRKASKASGSGTTSTAKAATTRKRASGNATATRKASSANAKPKAAG